MKVYKIFRSEEIHKVDFPMNTIILSASNGTMIVALPDAFKRHNKGRIRIEVWNGSRWIVTTAQNKYTEMLWDFQIRESRQRRKAEGKKYNGNYSAMMRHERAKKKGTGGEFLGKFCGTVTDYECAKRTLHDFPQSYTVLYN